jgi:hypothetical protein
MRGKTYFIFYFLFFIFYFLFFIYVTFFSFGYCRGKNWYNGKTPVQGELWMAFVFGQTLRMKATAEVPLGAHFSNNNPISFPH